MMMSVPHLSEKMKTKEPLGIRREQRISIWSIMEKKKYNTEKLLLQFDETLPPRVSENSFFLLNAIHRMCFNLTLYNDELMLHTFYICNEFFHATANASYRLFPNSDMLIVKLNILLNKCDYFKMLNVYGIMEKEGWKFKFRKKTEWKSIKEKKLKMFN